MHTLRLAFLVTLLTAATSLGVLSHSWLHPERHFEAPGYLDFMAACEGAQDWFSAVLLTELENGRMVGLTAHKDTSTGEHYVHINGDMRWVVHSSHPMDNLSESFVQGYNGGALDFVSDGQLHSLGGYGLWRRHFDLIRFNGGNEAWQLVATSGEAPVQRDKDASLLFEHGNTAYAFVDNVQSATRYDESNYVLYALDLDTRGWSRLGAVDASLGHMKAFYALGSKVLMLNEAGELIWLDVESMTAKLLANRSQLFDEFASWHAEQGRTSFYGDGHLWHVFGDERLEFEVPLQELNEVTAIPVAGPLGPTFMDQDNETEKRETEEAGTSEAQGSMVWTTLPWLAVLGLLLWVIQLQRTLKQAGPRGSGNLSAENGEADEGQGRFSALTEMVLTHRGKQFETEELDELLDIAHLSSPETLRSQRARLIQRVNTEYRVLAGEDLILRQRAFNDRRRSVYIIGATQDPSR